MLRPLLNTLIGIASAILVLFITGRLGLAIFPTLATFNPADSAQTWTMLTSQPVPALLWLALSWSLASTSGAFIGTKLGRGDRLPAAITIGFLVSAVLSVSASGAAPWAYGLAGIAAVFLGGITGIGLAQTREKNS